LAGYKNRTVTLEFPDLAEDGDRIYVALRNPRMVPVTVLRTRQVARDANGEALDPADEQLAVFEVYADLIVDWHVYDATSIDEDQPPLPLPATAELVGKLPLEIQERISEEVNERRNPTKTPTTGS
jgi:hypothetical protein